jgi:hypothetical protein
MRNLLLLLFVPFLMNGQETEKSSIFTRKHEVKIGTIKMLAGPILEASYEYIYSKDFTFKKKKNMEQKGFSLKVLQNF